MRRAASAGWSRDTTRSTAAEGGDGRALTLTRGACRRLANVSCAASAASSTASTCHGTRAMVLMRMSQSSRRVKSNKPTAASSST
jgi:hypothetical protein